MIIVLKPGCTQQQISDFCASLRGEYGVGINTWSGTQSTMLGLIGDDSAIDIDSVAAQELVESVKRVQEITRFYEETAFEIKKRLGNIVLCGFMGSGKTTIGGLLAGRTGRTFIDMDQWIEQREGCTVPEIFARYGESRFRRLEREASRELSLRTGIIIATGGGTIINPDNAWELRSGGTIIMLDASLHSVRTRLQGDLTRPLLRKKDGGRAMEQLYQERLPVYRGRSELIVPADGSPEQTADLVLKALQPNSESQPA
ncbi:MULTISPECIES: shikimate kinase [Acutalibacteraceae]|uniref:shikimate kinase n=1 Tax=Acutalibacteraceae TaxID=3082771 RepID=UPI0013E8D8DA|nr:MULTISPECIES: shikimate kinase [Acutalibacteraceae]